MLLLLRYRPPLDSIVAQKFLCIREVRSVQLSFLPLCLIHLIFIAVFGIMMR